MPFDGVVQKSAADPVIRDLEAMLDEIAAWKRLPETQRELIKVTEAIDVITKVRALLAKERNWTKGKYRVQKFDWFGLYPKIQYCLVGAFQQVTGASKTIKPSESAKCALDVLRNVIRTHHPWAPCVISFNDFCNTRHEHVLDVLDRTLLKLKAREQSLQIQIEFAN